LLYERIFRNGEEILLPENIKLSKNTIPPNVLLDNKFLNNLFKGQKEIADRNQVTKLLL